MKEKKFCHYLNDSETDIIIRSLVYLRNSLIKEGRFPDCVDDIIEIIYNAKFKRL